MSIHQAFRRQPVPQQIAQLLKATTIPAPTRGIVQSENEAFMLPGAAVIQDNWAPTMRGVKLRGGYVRWCDLHALDKPAWANNTAYTVGQIVYDPTQPIPKSFWRVVIAHTSAMIGTFADDRALHPTFWVDNPTSVLRKPVISSFEYVSASTRKMFAGQQTRLVDVTDETPVLVKSGQTSGNYAASQLSNASGDYLTVVNDAGDLPLRFDGTTWTTLSASEITVDIADYPGAAVEHGANLVYVWKYRGRLFFIEKNSMNAWYLGIDSIQGNLEQIPLSGAASKGGKLLFGAVWSLDAGDGADDKCIFATTEGEILIFTGSNPGDPNNWRQEGRYDISPPLGMNAHTTVGGDLLIATVDGIAPVSQAITKEAGQLELAMLTRNIKPMWRDEVELKRAHPWTIKKWDEYGGLFVTLPYGQPGARRCLVANNATGAWCRFVGWDATCFLKKSEKFYFGTQDGIVMEANVGGYDDGNHAKIPYVATLVGGWQQGNSEVVWRQSRAVFTAATKQPFVPQLTSTVDYVVTLPTPPAPGFDPGPEDVWDEGLWDNALWDQPSLSARPIRNTMWVSVGQTGFSHAPVVQVTVAQVGTVRVELIAISGTFEPAGVNV